MHGVRKLGVMGRGSASGARGSQGRSAQLERRVPGRPRQVTAARPALTAHGAAARSGARAVPPPLPPLPPLPPRSSRQAGRQRAPPRASAPPRKWSAAAEAPPPDPERKPGRWAPGAGAGSRTAWRCPGVPGRWEPSRERAVVPESPVAATAATEQDASHPPGLTRLPSARQ